MNVLLYLTFEFSALHPQCVRIFVFCLLVIRMKGGFLSIDDVIGKEVQCVFCAAET